MRVSFCVAGAAFAAAPLCVECHGIWDTLHFTLYSLHSIHSTLYTSHFTLYTLHFTLHTLRFTLHSPHSTLCTLHSTLCTLHSTLYKIDGRLERNNDLRSQIVRFMRKLWGSCENSMRCSSLCVSTSVPLTYVWAFGFVGCILFRIYASDVYVRYKSVCDWVMWWSLQIYDSWDAPTKWQIFWLNQQIWIVYPALLGIPRLSQLSEGLIFHAGENRAVAQNYCTISGNIPAIHRSPMNSEATVDLGRWPPGSQRPSQGVSPCSHTAICPEPTVPKGAIHLDNAGLL